jgi:hypothetical protein
MRAIFLFFVIWSGVAMANDPIRSNPGGLGGLGGMQQQRRALQQKIPGGLSPQEWDALNAETDRWQGSQPDGVMTVMELSAKYRTGQITKKEYDEGMDILQGAILLGPKRRK